MEVSESSPLISTYGALDIDDSQVETPGTPFRKLLPSLKILPTFPVAFLLTLISINCLNFYETQASTASSTGGIYLGAYSSSKWTTSFNSEVPKDHEITFFVGLKTKDFKELQQIFKQVSDPLSEEYGKYLSVEEISLKYGPPIDHQLISYDFFQQIPGAKIQMNLQSDLLRITAQVEHIENTLQTQLSAHSHVEFPHLKSIRASRPMVIPDHISEMISFISLNGPILHPHLALERNKQRIQINLQNLDMSENDEVPERPKTEEKQSMSTKFGLNVEAQAAAGTTSPYTWYTLYNIPFSKTNGKGSQAFVVFFGEVFKNSDILKYLTKADLQYATFSSMFPTSGKIIPEDRIYGQINNEAYASAEATLDSQVIVATAPDVPTHEYNMLSLNPYSYANEGFLDYLWIVGNQTNPPLVHSISYGDDESVVFESSGSTAYAYAVDEQFIKAGLRGLSIIFASGDTGVIGLAPNSVKCSQTWPIWPASSPYITSVGGTMLSSGVEVVFDRGSVSGGGFSNIYKRSDLTTWWQNSLVSAYVSSGSSAKSGYSSTGRGYPDVSALADDFLTVRGSYVTTISGTSASAPLFAGIVSRLNDQRLANGLVPLGFLNPFLYLSKAGFNDITSGNNNAGCAVGFSAASGWDAITGLGTPNYSLLKTAALSYVVSSNVKGSVKPTFRPTVNPTMVAPRPTINPTVKPTQRPSTRPSARPTTRPTTIPTMATLRPTSKPTLRPTMLPTMRPTTRPTVKPSLRPTSQPTVKPTQRPTMRPSTRPTTRPTAITTMASLALTSKPTVKPTMLPTMRPTTRPSVKPSLRPASQPTVKPTQRPTMRPTTRPTVKPSVRPTMKPTIKPTLTPTLRPTMRPSYKPTYQPTNKPK